MADGDRLSGKPWDVAVRGPTLVVTFPAVYRVLSWAPLNGGFA